MSSVCSALSYISQRTRAVARKVKRIAARRKADKADAITVSTQYVLGCPLVGTGSSFHVHEAKHTRTGRKLVVKRAKKADSEGCVILAKEYHFLNHLAPHPNIIEARGLVHVGDEMHLITEYYKPFSQFLNLTKREGLLAIKHILRGLAHVHEVGMAQGHISFDDIGMVDGVGKLVNFEHSVELAYAGERFSRPFGMLGYHSPQLVATIVKRDNLPVTIPEHLDGTHDPQASDMFALGVVLYEIFAAGYSPFARLDDSTGKIDVQKTLKLCLGTHRVYIPGGTEAPRFIELLMNVEEDRRPTPRQALEHECFVECLKMPNRVQRISKVLRRYYVAFIRKHFNALIPIMHIQHRTLDSLGRESWVVKPDHYKFKDFNSWRERMKASFRKWMTVTSPDMNDMASKIFAEPIDWAQRAEVQAAYDVQAEQEEVAPGQEQGVHVQIASPPAPLAHSQPVPRFKSVVEILGERLRHKPLPAIPQHRVRRRYSSARYERRPRRGHHHERNVSRHERHRQLLLPISSNRKASRRDSITVEKEMPSSTESSHDRPRPRPRPRPRLSRRRVAHQK